MATFEWNGAVLDVGMTTIRQRLGYEAMIGKSKQVTVADFYTCAQIIEMMSTIRVVSGVFSLPLLVVGDEVDALESAINKWLDADPTLIDLWRKARDTAEGVQEEKKEG